MRLIVADHTGRARGGREQYADDLVRHISTHHADIRIALAKLPLTASTAGDDLRVLALSPAREATHYQLHGGLLAPAFAAERESLSSSVRRAFFNHGLRLNRRRQRMMSEEAAVIESSARLMVFSDAIARDLVERHGVPPHRVCVERPGVDLRRFNPAGDLGDQNHRRPLRLVFVGHNFALKGLPTAIAALARLRRGGVDAALTVAGAGSAAMARRWARQHGVGDRVSFLGPLSQDAMAALYRSQHVLVHPTYYDPFPRTVIEAMASGCAIVTTRRCGTAEILTHGREALVIAAPGDADALSGAVATLADPDVRAAMRGHAAAAGRRFDDSTHFRATCRWLFHEGHV